MMIRRLIAILLLPLPLSAAGPLFEHKDRLARQEWDNVYSDIASPKIGTGSAQTLTISSATVTNLTVTASTTTRANISNATISTATITTLMGNTGAGGNPSPALPLDALGAIKAGRNSTASDSYLVLTRSDASFKLANETVFRIYRDASYTTNPTTKIFEISQTGQIMGTVAGDDAAAGSLGEWKVSNVVGITPATSGSWGNVTSLSLTAGDWDVSGTVFGVGGSPLHTNLQVGISVESGTSFNDAINAYTVTYAAVNSNTTVSAATLPKVRINVTGTTTVYLKGLMNYSGTGQTLQGSIQARRIR